jgi:parallel beta-helix repeat protein
MRFGTIALAILLLSSLFVTVLFIGRSSANFIPEQAPAGIVIKADGSVEGTDLIRYTGGVYMFTGDIHRTIVILRDGVVIDGAGFRLQGSGSSVGFFLQSRKNVEIRNVTISNFEIGVKFTWQIYDSPATPTRNTVSGSTIVNNTYGILFSDPHTIVALRDNKFLDNQYGVFDNVAGGNDVDTSNTVNGKPIYYWVDEHDKAVPSDAGFVVLKNCSGITVKNVDLQGNEQGILLYYTNGTIVEGNFLANNMEGITLRQSFHNRIANNRISDNSGHGVHLEFNSENNVVSGNRIESNEGDGIYDGYYSFGGSPGNIIVQNQIANNSGNGVSIYVEQDSEISGNNITLNGGCGIRLAYGTANITVKGNFIAKNGLGIQVESPSQAIVTTDTVVNGTVRTTPTTIVPKGSTITENTVTENRGWGIRLNNSEGGNIIYHNNFINNNVTDGLQVSIPAIWIFDPPGSEKNGPTLAPGNQNVWDDGKEGNYWSEYTSRYPNASEVGSTGVGDTSFYINENNVDRYPLTSPFKASQSSSPSASPPTEHDSTNSPNTETKPEPFPVLVVAVTVAVTASTAVTVGCIITFRRRSRQVEPQ